MQNWEKINPNKLTLNIPGSQSISDIRRETNHLDLAILNQADNIVLGGFKHVIDFGQDKNVCYVSIRIQQGELVQDGCYLQLEKTASVYLEDINKLDPSGYLVTYVQFEYNEEEFDYITDNKYKLGISYISSDGSIAQPYTWDHNTNKTVLNIFKFTLDGNKLTDVYEYSSDNIDIGGQTYYKKGHDPRFLSSGEGGGDMFKAIYDINQNNIIDKAEKLDDGSGNVVTPLEVKTHINDHNLHAIISDASVATDVVWSSQKIQEEINALDTNWDDILNKPDLYTQTDIDTMIADLVTSSELATELAAKADLNHTHVESDITDLDKYTQSEVDGFLATKSDTDHLHDDRYYQKSEVDGLVDGFVTLDDTVTSTTSGWSSQKIQEEINIITSGSIEWDSILNKPDLYTQTDIDTMIADLVTSSELATELAAKADLNHTHVESDITDLDKYTQSEVDGFLATKSDTDHLHDDRYPVLDTEDKIPSHYIPTEFKESKVVDTITDRDNITDTYESLRVHVLDASDDSTVNSGGAGYIYHNSTWIKLYEEESLDTNIDWLDVLNKPDLYTQSEIDGFLATKSDDTHTHIETEITDLDKYTQSEVDGFLATKSDTDHLHDDRYPILDSEDKIPVTYLYADNHIVVDTIADRDAISNPENGTKVFVKDASNDPEVTTGNAGYMYYDGSWIRTHSEESLNVSQEWGDILNKPDLYTQSEIDGFLATKSDDNHTHVESEIADLDKYTQSEVDGFLATKSDDNHTHEIVDVNGLQIILDEKLIASNNLSDLTDTQLALNTLTNSSAAATNQVLSRDNNGDVIWKTLEDSGLGKVIGEEYIIVLGPGNSIQERIDHINTILPQGWAAYQGDDSANVDANFGSDPLSCVIEHTLSNNFVCDAQILERRDTGPDAVHGYPKVNYSSVSIPWKSNMAKTQVYFKDLLSVTNDDYFVYLYIKLTNDPLSI